MKKILAVLTAVSISAVLFAQRDYAANVEIVRDSFGVPHIFGKTDADVAYGLGWATCEDDFETLQWALLAGKHMMARWKGVEGAKIDYAVQLLRIRELVDERYEKDLSPEVREYIEAHVAAVNKYASLHPEEVKVKKAFPANGKDIVSGYVLSYCLLSGVTDPLQNIVEGKIKPISWERAGKGSNTFAINSKFSKDGNTYLDINSHQPLEGPLSWYEAHLVSEEGMNILGGTFHGGVTIFHGVNQFLGWAHTVNLADFIDVYQLQPDPKKKGHYIVDGESIKLETGKAKLFVNVSKKGKLILPVKKKIWNSIYGPTLVTKQGIFSMRLAAATNCKTLEQYFHMNKAKSFTEWRNALDIGGAAMMTFAYADKYDTIYALSNSLAPKRAAGYDWLNVVPGNTRKTLWTEFHPIADLPQVLNPACGYVFNTNNSAYQVTSPKENLTPANFDVTMGYSLDETNRSRRFYEMIGKYDKMDWNDFLQLKYDNQYPEKVSMPFRDLDINDITELSEKDYPDIADAIKSLKQWNKRSDVADTNCALFIKSFYSLYNALGDKELERKCRENKKFKFDTYAQYIRVAKNELLASFGTINPPLGKVQIIERGGKEVGISGCPDQWRAAYGNPYGNGKIKLWGGESYICLVKFTKDGPEVSTVSPFGASNKPGAKHSMDQMDLYANMKTKKMPLDKDYWYKHAEAIYHPK
jgi:acyl-homoserine-lactone acylase